MIMSQSEWEASLEEVCSSAQVLSAGPDDCPMV